jgi:hypothetical protein
MCMYVCLCVPVCVRMREIQRRSASLRWRCCACRHPCPPSLCATHAPCATWRLATGCVHTHVLAILPNSSTHIYVYLCMRACVYIFCVVVVRYLSVCFSMVCVGGGGGGPGQTKETAGLAVLLTDASVVLYDCGPCALRHAPTRVRSVKYVHTSLRKWDCMRQLHSHLLTHIHVLAH